MQIVGFPTRRLISLYEAAGWQPYWERAVYHTLFVLRETVLSISLMSGALPSLGVYTFYLTCFRYVKGAGTLNNHQIDTDNLQGE